MGSGGVLSTQGKFGNAARFSGSSNLFMGRDGYASKSLAYGGTGNSFVAVVEFGSSVSARAVTAGGLNSVPGSRHFNDQAARYAAGQLREIYFYPKQLEGHIERSYRPGER
jgi:acyl-homoserine lactone acylase PvdQ